MFCKNCGKILEGNPHYCMNCGSELFPVKPGKFQIEKSYLLLWGVILGLILILLVMALRGSPPPDSGTLSTRVNSPVTAPQGIPPNTVLSGSEHSPSSSPESTVYQYAAALSSSDKSAAVALWRNPSAKLAHLVANVRSMHINSLKTDRETADHAEVWVDMVARSSQSGAQHWRGTVDLQKVDSRWLITSMKRVQCVEGCSGSSTTAPAAATGDSELFLAEAPLVQQVVSDYYAALNSHHIQNARAKRKNVPNGFDQLVSHIKHAGINRMDDPVIQGVKARVWVDVSLQSIDGSLENWKGAIELERNDHTGWLISSMKSGLAKR